MWPIQVFCLLHTRLNKHDVHRKTYSLLTLSIPRYFLHSSPFRASMFHFSSEEHAAYGWFNHLFPQHQVNGIGCEELSFHTVFVWLTLPYQISLVPSAPDVIFCFPTTQILVFKMTKKPHVEAGGHNNTSMLARTRCCVRCGIYRLH